MGRGKGKDITFPYSLRQDARYWTEVMDADHLEFTSQGKPGAVVALRIDATGIAVLAYLRDAAMGCL